MIRFAHHLAALFCLPMLALVFAAPAAAQRDAQRDEVLTVATRAAPPFVMQDEDGQWDGLAIALWDAVAQEQGLEYRLVETDLPGMVAGVRDGRFDLSVGAVTITPDRETQIDFTHAYYTTGFGIAVRETPATWYVLIANMMSWDFFKAVLALGAMLLVVGALFWLAERRRNPEQFGGGALRGLGSGFWFSAVTMTTVGYGDKAPVSLAGRLVALAWMFGAILVISTFTGMIASSLTAGRLAGVVAGPSDLDKVAVGSIKGSASDHWLSADGVRFRSFASVEAGLAALRDQQIGAFVYDKPILRYLVRRQFSDDLRLVPGTFGRQDYGIVLPEGSARREALNVALLNYIESDAWQQQQMRELGRED